MTRPFFYILLLVFFLSIRVHAQENYEIQVYGSQTVAKGNTMVELHSNYTFDGQRYGENGVLPTRHVFHETIEITQGLTAGQRIVTYGAYGVQDSAKVVPPEQAGRAVANDDAKDDEKADAKGDARADAKGETKAAPKGAAKKEEP